MKLACENDAIFDFLTMHGFSPDFEEVSADWSTRQYYRVKGLSNNPAILMVCLDETQRSYMQAFITIAEKLRLLGLSAPEIYAHDLSAGFMLLEDFGNKEFADIIEQDIRSSSDLYSLAGQVLKNMSETPGISDGLPDFFSSSVYKGHVRVLDWYVPSALKIKIDPSWREKYLKIWEKIEDDLPIPEKGFVHIDYHPANMMLLENKTGLKKCGILDFQNGCRGPIAYDYTNLLKDIRRDVPTDVQHQVLQKALEGMNENAQKSFKIWYDVLALQFHFRIAGQVIKLALETGRDDLLEFLPRTLGYIREELKNPLFVDLKQFFEDIGVNFASSDISLDEKYISDTAF